MRARTAVLALMLTAVLGPAAYAPGHAAPHSPSAGTAEWIPVRDPIQDEFELLRASGLADTSITVYTRPLDRRTVAAVTARARRLHPESRDPSLVRLERAFGRELVDWGYPAPAGYTPPLAIVTDPGDPDGMRARIFGYAEGALVSTRDLSQFEDRSRFGGRLNLETGGLLLHLDAYAGRVVNGRNFSDQLVTGSDFIAYSEDTYGSLAGHGLDASLGRIGYAWGPGRTGSLLWSETADPVTALNLGATLFGRVRATALAGDIDASRGARIAGHRLEWFPSPRLTIGLAEAARYSSTRWEPLYLVPLLPYTWVQRILAHDQLGGSGPGADIRNNVMAAIDASWRARPGTLLYGEFLLDDQGLRISGSPTRIGYQGGVLATRGAGASRWTGRLEYTRVYRYVYSVFYGADFIHHDKPIGYPAGPDSRGLFAEARLAPSAALEFALSGAQQDQGEGGLGQFFNPDSSAAQGSLLSGVVERTRTLGAEARWWPRDGVDLSASLERDWRTNAGHVEGAGARRWALRVGARLHR
ncbi:MAG: capsule assembly Wzi family protein [Candidatus Eisenbacteria bacterium]